jgi:hypothetical protein
MSLPPRRMDQRCVWVAHELEYRWAYGRGNVPIMVSRVEGRGDFPIGRDVGGDTFARALHRRLR